jgi:Tol biopolymer transport system component
VSFYFDDGVRRTVNDSAWQALSELVRKHGQGLCDDPLLLRSLLNGYCPELEGEVNVLVTAAEHRLVAELRNSSTGLPWSVVSGSLARRMVDELGVDESAARLAIETWGIALGRRPIPGAGPSPGGTGTAGTGQPSSPRPSLSSSPTVEAPPAPAAPRGLGRRVLQLFWPTFWFFFRAVAVLLTLGFDVAFLGSFLRSGTPSPSSRFVGRLTTIFILMHLVVLGAILATFKEDLRRLYNSWTGRPPPIAEGQTAVFWPRAFWRGFRRRTGRFLGLFEQWVVLPSTVTVFLLYLYLLITEPPPWKVIAETHFLTLPLFLVPFLVLAAQVRHLLQTRAPGRRVPRTAFWAVGCGVWMLLYGAFGWPFNKGPVAAIRLTGPASISDLAFSHDGKRLAAVSYQNGEEKPAQGRLVIWDLELQKEIVNHHFDSEGAKEVRGATKVSFHPNNRFLAVSFGSFELQKPSYIPDILVWDIPGGTEIRRIPGTQAVFSPDGAHLAVVSHKFPTCVIRMLETSTMSASRDDRTITVPWLLNGPDFSPSGDHLSAIVLEKALDVGNERIVQTLVIWDVATGVETTRIRVKDADEIFQFAWSPDGTRLALGTAGDGAVRIWDWQTHQELKKIAFESKPSDHSFVFLPDGKRLAVVGAEYELVAYDIESDRAVPLRTRAFSEDPPSNVGHLTISAPGKLAANAGTTVYVWNLP